MNTDIDIADGATPTGIDQATGTTGQGYTLTRAYQAGNFKIRVRVVRDGYARQSYAVAEVLSALLTWTELATNPASNWHGSTGHAATHPDTIVAELGGLADELARRAVAILTT